MELKHLLILVASTRAERSGPNLFSFLFLSFFLLFRATPAAHEVPRLGVELELQLLAYTTAHGNTGSLTH